MVDANDTVYPAAVGYTTLPIYGMPIIRADLAEIVGFENELLYNPKTTLVVCDAKGTFTTMVASVKASSRRCSLLADERAGHVVRFIRGTRSKSKSRLPRGPRRCRVRGTRRSARPW